jgi:hypothetical protein
MRTVDQIPYLPSCTMRCCSLPRPAIKQCCQHLNMLHAEISPPTAARPLLSALPPFQQRCRHILLYPPWRRLTPRLPAISPPCHWSNPPPDVPITYLLPMVSPTTSSPRHVIAGLLLCRQSLALPHRHRVHAPIGLASWTAGSDWSMQKGSPTMTP